METFEFLVTSTAMVTLQEHIKIQAQDLDDAIAKIEDRDYYEEAVYMSCFNGRMFLFSPVLHYHRQVLRN